VNGRHFVFASGIGLDASVVERVDAHPRLKAGSASGTSPGPRSRTFNRRYLVNPPRVRVETPAAATLEA
jgi:diacylglycerol kinase family enzyme